MAWYHIKKVVLTQAIVSETFLTYDRWNWERLIQYSMVCIVAIMMWKLWYVMATFDTSKGGL